MPGPEEIKPNRETDPDVLARALELELITKRAAWQRMQGRRGTWRTLSFLFLLLVILGSLLAYFYFATALPRPAGEKPAAAAGEDTR